MTTIMQVCTNQT